jgi:hypothetical protein
MAAQALALRRVVPGTGTIDIVSCRARVVLFRIVLVPARRARAKWPGIAAKALMAVLRSDGDDVLEAVAVNTDEKRAWEAGTTSSHREFQSRALLMPFVL